MAAVRPLVLVYQELKNVNATAENPQLETLVAGPCYHIQDYPADRDKTGIGSYGVKNAACDNVTGSSAGRPRDNTNAVVLSQPPNNVVGAQLDHDSVVVFMENVILEVATGLSGDFGTSPDENLFTISGGGDLKASGVKAGDRLVVTDASGANPETFDLLIQEVTSATEIRTTTNFTPGMSGLAWRVERVLDAPVQLSKDFISLSDNEIVVKGGIYHLADIDKDGVDEPVPVNYAEIFIAYRALRKDLAKVTVVNENNLETVLGAVDERNPLAAGAQVALSNTTTSIQVYGVDGDNLNGALDMLTAYSQMCALLESRNDVYAIVPLTRDDDVIRTVWSHAVEFSKPDKAKFRTVIANNKKLPLIKSMSIGDAGTAEEAPNDDISVLVVQDAGFKREGVRFNDVLCVVGDTAASTRDGAYVVKNVYDDDRVHLPGLHAAGSGATADAQYYVVRNSGALILSLQNVSVTGPGEISVPTSQASTEHVGSVIRLAGTTANKNASPVVNDDYLITAVDAGSGTYTVVGPSLAADVETFNAEIISVVMSKIAPDEVVSRKAFRRVLDNNASFSSNGVVPSDILEIPLPPAIGGTDYNDAYQATIEAVLSENRIQLVEGSDIPTLDPVAGQAGDLGYRVARSLDKDGQKEALLGVVDASAGGYSSKRLVLVWPDECLLSNVQNNATGTRSRQPGYYLACAVGGMSAGLPPHQGFTFIGLSGIDEIYHSSRYFREDDLTDLSNSGYYVFLQDTSNSPAYAMHQLTTDTSVMENMELSMVRDFDYVSRFYKKILDEYIGRYNVTPQTLDLLRESLNAGTDQLKSNVLPKIGAPILGASVKSISPLEGQRDRVEIYMDVELPAPLNRLGLHLVA